MPHELKRPTRDQQGLLRPVDPHPPGIAHGGVAPKRPGIARSRHDDAGQKSDGTIVYRSLRNAFIDVEINDFTKKMLTKLGVQYVLHNRKMYVMGNPAFELANIFNRETRRPMAAGLLSPHEADALPIIRLLVSQTLGEPAREGEKCFFSIPGEPIDAQMNVVYHRDIFNGLLVKMSRW